tara:strand:- start:94708 stop:95376 length:669 start_codon:yes stop_codon:yes gene_type:complete
MSQIGLPFDWAGQVKAGQFLLSDANRIAAEHIERWRHWPVPISILSGPSRSGKSTLGRHFLAISDGVMIDEADRQEEQALFHAWNIARDTHRPLLLIGEHPPELWPVTLPDLRSRLAAAPHVRIAEPDDALVRALLETGLAQAGSAYAADLPEWLARRIERSYRAVADVLDALNRLSLASARKISVAAAKEALQKSGFLPIVAEDSPLSAARETDRKSFDDV